MRGGEISGLWPDFGWFLVRFSGPPKIVPNSASQTHLRPLLPHITNIAEDGTVPAVEAANWQAPGLNNYRQNVQPQGEFSAPDVTAAIFPICDNLPYALVARVRNIGQAAVPAGVVVGFYAGDPDMGGMLLGSGMTKKSLYPAEAEDVVLELAMPDPGLIDGSIPVFVVVDDGMPAHLWKECRTTNNKVEGSGYCAMPG